MKRTYINIAALVAICAGSQIQAMVGAARQGLNAARIFTRHAMNQTASQLTSNVQGMPHSMTMQTLAVGTQTRSFVTTSPSRGLLDFLGLGEEARLKKIAQQERIFEQARLKEIAQEKEKVFIEQRRKVVELLRKEDALMRKAFPLHEEMTHPTCTFPGSEGVDVYFALIKQEPVAQDLLEKYPDVVAAARKKLDLYALEKELEIVRQDLNDAEFKSMQLNIAKCDAVRQYEEAKNKAS